MSGDLRTAPRIISLSSLSLATDLTRILVTQGNGLWLGTRTGAHGTATLTKKFFFRPQPMAPCDNRYIFIIYSSEFMWHVTAFRAISGWQKLIWLIVHLKCTINIHIKKSKDIPCVGGSVTHNVTRSLYEIFLLWLLGHFCVKASSKGFFIYTFKYHFSCTVGNISIRIIYFYYLFFHRCPNEKLSFLSCMPFVINATFLTGLVVPSVSWLG